MTDLDKKRGIDASKSSNPTTTATTQPPQESVGPTASTKQMEDLSNTKDYVEKQFEYFKQVIQQGTGDNPIVKKSLVSSFFNDYAFISYGGAHISKSDMKNAFISGEGAQGLMADYEKWKDPTAKNIIEWSKSISVTKPVSLNNNESTLNGQGNNIGSSLGDTNAKTADNVSRMESVNKQLSENVTGMGNFQFRWKDFAFLKHYGKIPNNHLITLRRFKLPVLDSGVIASKKKFIESLGKDEAYITSDSARALAYFGEDTGNDIDTLSSFTTTINWGQVTLQSGPNGGGLEDLYGNGGGSKTKNALDQLGVDDLLKTLQGVPGLKFLEGLDPTKTGGVGKEIFNRIFNTYYMLVKNQQDKKKKEDAGVTPGKYQDYYDYVTSKSKDFNPWLNSWKNRIYGPINAITKTHRRERGLDYQNALILTFKFDTMQIDSMNPKIAMLDVLSNMLALTYNNGQFWGGDYRFFQELTDLPLDTALSDLLLEIGAGKTNSIQLDKVTEAMVGQIETLKSSFVNGIIGNGTDTSNSLMGELTEMQKIAKDTEIGRAIGDLTTKLKDAGGDPGKISEVLTNDYRKVLLSLSSDKNGANILKQMSTADNAGKFNIIKSAIGIVGLGQGANILDVKNSLVQINPLTTGEPVGEWHLTVGNPMNPIMMIGNLICKNATFKFGKTLGPDDFPTELEVKVTLDHGRPRDMGDIQSIFNLGQGRFYNIAQVNGNKSDEPWDTGASSKNTENDTSVLPEEQFKELQRKENEANTIKNGVVGANGRDSNFYNIDNPSSVETKSPFDVYKESRA